MSTAPGGLRCPRHLKEVTHLRCARCGTPICSRCAVLTSVGHKCHRCGTFRNSAMCMPTLLQGLLLVLIGLLGGAAGVWLLGAVGLFAIWLSFPYGRILGTVMLRVSGYKIGQYVNVISISSIIAGGFGMRLLGPEGRLLRYLFTSLGLHYLLTVLHPSSLIILALIVAAVISRYYWSRSFWGY